MLLYCDTSALLKLLIDEEGSDSMVRTREDFEGTVVCRITWAEAMAAFAQRSRVNGANLTAWGSPDFVDTDQGVTGVIVRAAMNCCS